MKNFKNVVGMQNTNSNLGEHTGELKEGSSVVLGNNNSGTFPATVLEKSRLGFSRVPSEKKDNSFEKPVTSSVSSGDVLKANLVIPNPVLKGKNIKVEGEPEQKPLAKEFILDLNNVEPGQNILINKKRKNPFIDDEAEEDMDSMKNNKDENEDDEKDEYDKNDSFINDEEEDQEPGHRIVKYRKLDNMINEEKKYITLKPKKFIDYFDIDKALLFNNDLRTDLNNFLINYTNLYNFNYEFKSLDKVFEHNYSFWFTFIKFISKIFQFNNNIDFTMWDDLALNEVKEEIKTFFNKIIKDRIERHGKILNFIYFYILNLNFQQDLLYLYKEISKYFEGLDSPDQVYIEILSNPGQEINKFYKANLINFEKYEKEFAEFYSDKDPDYDLKQDKLKEEEKQKLIDLNIKKKEYLDKAKKELESIPNSNFVYNDTFDNDFEIVDDKEELFKVNHKLDSKSFGIVLYMDKLNYNLKDMEKNKNIHMPHLLPTLAKGILFYLKRVIPTKRLNKLIIAHEHGTKYYKCHIQAFLEFSDRINLTLCPGSFKIKYREEVTMANYDDNHDKEQIYLIMFQSAKKKYALQNYVKKKDELVPENKYLEYEFDHKIVKDCFDNFQNLENKEADNKVDKSEEEKELYNLLLNMPGLDYQTLKEICINNDRIAAKKFIIQNFERIIKVNKLVNKVDDIPEFKWNFPQYAIDYINNYKADKPGFLNNDLYSFYLNTYNWFNRFCLNNDPDYFDSKNSNRKLGLLVYGERGIGKTTFFQNLCGEFPNVTDNPFIIYCRNTITCEDFQKKMDTARLIILDDITFIKNQKEIIKALIVGQPVKLRSLYNDNVLFNKSIPCVILTNNLDTYDYMSVSNEFYLDLVKLGIDFYIGHPGTAPERQNIYFNSEGVKAKLNERRERKRNKLNNKFFNNNNYSFYNNNLFD